MHDPQDGFFQPTIFISMKMTARTLKQTELARTLTELKPLIAAQRGCMLCTVCIEECGGHRVTMVQRWRRADDLNSHVDSDHFFVLMTAVRMFTRTAAMTVSSNDNAYALDIRRSTESGDVRVWIRKALAGLCRQVAGAPVVKRRLSA